MGNYFLDIKYHIKICGFSLTLNLLVWFKWYKNGLCVIVFILFMLQFILIIILWHSSQHIAGIILWSSSH